MIGSKKAALTQEQCSDVIAVAETVGFQRAAVRNPDGSSSYNDTHRDSSTSFIRPEQLQKETWDAILKTITDLNEELYAAVVDNFDLQVARYSEGQIGFGWHSDDPPYPSEGLLWSGRKLTYVFELSDSSSYRGGYLDVEPYRSPRPLNLFAQQQNQIGAALVGLGASRMDIVDGNKMVIYLGDSPTQNIPAMLANEQIPVYGLQQQINRDIGDCVVFPSFFYHRVNPMISGTRYSLTIWAKGPKWV